ncbi:MAG: type II toxin-antitoxin system RelE/ParE family toxin [Alphaproteobacteria bacterium]|nr:type II toxin-antitoxin system RelE/ParE family toxin [Alphaproteobacteria bacterium]
MNCILRPADRADLADIWAYGAQEWGVDQADRYVTGIASRIGNAAGSPGIGSPVGGLPSTYRKLAFGSHRVVYRVSESDLIVVRILHFRQEVPDIFEDDRL